MENKIELEKMAEAYAGSKAKPISDYFNGLYEGFLDGYEALRKKVIGTGGGYTKQECRSGYGCKYQYPNPTDCKRPDGCVHKRTITYKHEIKQRETAE